MPFEMISRLFRYDFQFLRYLCLKKDNFESFIIFLVAYSDLSLILCFIDLSQTLRFLEEHSMHLNFYISIEILR